MCQRGCLYENKYTGDCRLPKGYPCIEDYETEEEFEDAVKAAEWYKEMMKASCMGLDTERI